MDVVARDADTVVGAADALKIGDRHEEARELELCVTSQPNHVVVKRHRRDGDGIEGARGRDAHVGVGAADVVEGERERAQRAVPLLDGRRGRQPRQPLVVGLVHRIITRCQARQPPMQSSSGPKRKSTRLTLVHGKSW
eukprot:4832874-Prymnesium_polylepis.1